jgi:hypothetical protein
LVVKKLWRNSRDDSHLGVMRRGDEARSCSSLSELLEGRMLTLTESRPYELLEVDDEGDIDIDDDDGGLEGALEEEEEEDTMAMIVRGEGEDRGRFVTEEAKQPARL